MIENNLWHVVVEIPHGAYNHLFALCHEKRQPPGQTKYPRYVVASVSAATAVTAAAGVRVEQSLT